MNNYYITIIEVNSNGGFAVFRRSDGEYGWLEPINCDVNIGDVLEEIRPRSFNKCGAVECMLNGNKRKIYINDLGDEKTVREQYSKYAQ